MQSFLLGYYPEEVKGEIQWRWKNLKWLLEVNVKRPSKECKAKGSSTRSKEGLNKVAKQKAILVASYYKKNNLPVVDIMKLMGIKSKPTLYKYLVIQGRRNCKECGIIYFLKLLS